MTTTLRSRWQWVYDDQSDRRLDAVDRLARQQVRLRLWNRRKTGAGVGYGGERDGSRHAGTYSWGGLYGTYFFVDPEEKLIGVLMVQVHPNDQLTLRSEFQRLVYEAIQR